MSDSLDAIRRTLKALQLDGSTRRKIVEAYAKSYMEIVLERKLQYIDDVLCFTSCDRKTIWKALGYSGRSGIQILRNKNIPHEKFEVFRELFGKVVEEERPEVEWPPGEDLERLALINAMVYFRSRQLDEKFDDDLSLDDLTVVEAVLEGRLQATKSSPEELLTANWGLPYGYCKEALSIASSK